MGVKNTDKQKGTSEMKKHTIKIYVEGGVVQEVDNLPENFNYEVIDYDEIDAREEDNKQKGTSEVKVSS